VPVLEPGDIVIMDNLGSHKSLAIRQMVRTAGARLWDLPPYSPVLDPIEQAYAKIKHWMRRHRSEPSIRHGNTSAALVPSLQRGECSNYFAKAGYASVKT
jgi:transposase